MKFYWNLDEKDYQRFWEDKHVRTEEDEQYPDGYLGTVRVGNLAFDLMNHDECIRFDLYVGGEDTGYGYGTDDYPYDFCDSFNMDFYKKYSSMKMFKKAAEKRLRRKLKKMPMYCAMTQDRAWSVNPLSKAKEPLRIW